MKAVLRSIGAVVAGLLVMLVLIIAVELFSSVVHPFPEGVPQTQEEICRHVERYPDWVLAAVVPMWAGAALASIWIAGRIGNVYASAFLMLLLFTALACNLWMLPYPAWFRVANLLLIPLAAFAGARLAWRRSLTSEIPNI